MVQVPEERTVMASMFCQPFGQMATPALNLKHSSSVHLPVSVLKGAKSWASRRWRVIGTA